MKKLTTEEFIKRAHKLYDDRYDLSEVFYENSKEKVKITCNKHNIIFYQIPNTFFNNRPGCDKCLQEKKKQTMLEKYGEKNYNNRTKAKQTCINKYDVENPSQVEKIKEKKKNAFLKHYGVENPFQSEEIKEKMKQTNLKNLGVEYPMQSSNIQKKVRQTSLKNYGVENAQQSPEIKEKVKRTNLKNLGVEYPMQSLKIRTKSKQTNLKRYGVEYSSQSHISQEALMLLNDPEYLKYQHHDKKLTLFEIAIKLGIDSGTIGKYFKKFNISVRRFQRSSGEIQVDKFIQSLGYLTIPNYQDILPGKHEIDIFIPEINKAIEYNGLHWHKNKKTNYHLWKTDQSAIKSIPLFHVWEDAWLYNQKETKCKIIKFINNEPQVELLDQIKIDLATDNSQIYISLGYKIQDQLPPQLYSDGIWDCGKLFLGKINE